MVHAAINHASLRGYRIVWMCISGAVLTKLDGESRRHLQGDEILQLGKVGVVECLNQVKGHQVSVH